MAENITARDLMKPSFLRLGAEHTLRQILSILLDPLARGEDPRVLIALDSEGGLAGVLTTPRMIEALLPEWIADHADDERTEALERKALSAMRENLDLKIADVMRADTPAVDPQARLPLLIDRMLETRMDCLPVMEGSRVVGVVYLTDVFSAAAGLALAGQPDSGAT